LLYSSSSTAKEFSFAPMCQAKQEKKCLTCLSPSLSQFLLSIMGLFTLKMPVSQCK
jgi:hypothetical protein